MHTEESLNKFLKLAGFKKIEFIYYQRYNINNHFKWILENKPNGHNENKKMFNVNIQKRYNSFLENSKLTDTLIAIAKI